MNPLEFIAIAALFVAFFPAFGAGMLLAFGSLKNDFVNMLFWWMLSSTTCMTTFSMILVKISDLLDPSGLDRLGYLAHVVSLVAIIFVIVAVDATRKIMSEKAPATADVQ